MRKRDYKRFIHITPDGKRTVVSFILLVLFLVVMYIVQPEIMKF